jgi:hypothetical protein
VDRADLLRETPAAVRFVSAEPLLGPLVHDARQRALSGSACRRCSTHDRWSDGYAGPELDLTSIDWLIAGGESGPKARPCREEWLRDLRDACAQTGTAYFLKQLGTRLGARARPEAARAAATRRRSTASSTTRCQVRRGRCCERILDALAHVLGWIFPSDRDGSGWFGS